MVQAFWRVVALVGVTLVVSGCGNDCEEALEVMCQKACECGDGDSCSVSFTGNGLSGTSVDACVKTFTKLGGSCGDADTNDYGACLSDLESAKCDEFGFGLEGPDSCAPPE